MRKPLLIIATFGLLVGLFALYLMQQPEHKVQQRDPASMSADDFTPPSERTTLIGPVQQTVVRLYDKRTGQLSSEFEAEEYLPQPDGRMRVTHPKAIFFLKDNQLIRIKGQTGLVTMSQAPSAGANATINVGGSPPSRGDLKQVQIDFFSSQEAMALEQTQMTINMDNCAFDTETFRIFTEQSVIDGKSLTGEEIPVVVRGRDYDFDGRGLTIRWNERDRRLELLRIVHGDRLIVKDPKLIRGMAMDGAVSDASLQNHSVLPATGVSEPSAHATVTPFDLPILSASDLLNTRKISLSEAMALAAMGQLRAEGAPDMSGVQTPATKPLPQVYQANFDRDVRVMQGGQKLVAADQMLVDFTFDSALKSPGDKSSTATSPSTTSPNTTTSGIASSAMTPDRLPAVPDATAASSISQPAGTSSAATQPSPIEIYWSGELRVTPLPDDAPRPSPGGAMVHLVASPLKLDRDGRTLECGRLNYDTASEVLSLEPYGNSPVVMSDPTGIILNATSMQWQTRENIIQFPGGGQATLPMASLSGDKSGGKPSDKTNDKGDQTLTALWSKNCKLVMAGQWKSGVVELHEAILNGDVIIDSPDMHMQGQSLSMEFEPQAKDQATSPATDKAPAKKGEMVAAKVNLRKVTAKGDVQCDFINGNDKQHAAGQLLELVTAYDAGGKVYPKLLTIDGKGQIKADGSEMSAEHLLARFLPADPVADAAGANANGNDSAGDATSTAASPPADFAKNVKLDYLLARDDVNLKTADGAFAIGERLEISGTGQSREISLLGDPVARVSDGKNTFSGPSLVAYPNQQKVSIVGAGSLQAQRMGADTSTGQPITIEWTEGANIDGTANRGEVRGGVTVTTAESDGTVSGITAGKAILDLATAPPDPKASSRPKANAQVTSMLGIEPMDDKVVTKVTFMDNPTVLSLLTDSQGNLLRRLTLYTTQISYDLSSGQMAAPGYGRLLYEDHRPTDDQTASQDAMKDKKFDASRLRGATAMEWFKELAFDRQKGVITLSQDVRIVHIPDEPQPDAKDTSDQQWELLAQQVTATMEPAAEKATSIPAENASVDSMAKMTLRKIAADDKVLFTNKDVEMTAGHIDFDPETGLLSAKGTGRNPVEVRRGLSPGTFSEVVYNVRTKMIDRMRYMNGTLRQEKR